MVLNAYFLPDCEAQRDRQSTADWYVDGVGWHGGWDRPPGSHPQGEPFPRPGEVPFLLLATALPTCWRRWRGCTCSSRRCVRSLCEGGRVRLENVIEMLQGFKQI
jgi:hypothetical protein